MLSRVIRCAAVAVLFLTSAHLQAADDATPAAAPATTATRVSELAWLAGHWRGTLANGALFEAHYTNADGATIVSASKEVRKERTVAFELELFFEKDGRVVYQPFPNGKRSEHAFPLIAFDAAAKRAVFENKEHDFPQTFVFEQPTANELVITLSGPGKDGATKQFRYALSRVVN